MSITIFKDKNCKGKSRAVNGNIADLKGKAVDKPSSIRLTEDREAVLLFKNDDWHGGALYVRGPKTVEDLGDGKDGGRFGFGNSVRSIRHWTRPFELDLNVTVVKDEGGKLPGDWKTVAEARDSIEGMARVANAYFIAQRAILKLNVARVTFRTAPNLFTLSKLEHFVMPGEWTERGEVDVIFVNRFKKEGTLGRGKFPCWGQAIAIARTVNSDVGPDRPLGLHEGPIILVHELGHYLGLSHNTADGKRKNLMFPELTQDLLEDTYLTVDQIREMHDRLANNITRKGDRN
jgi:hypothetical protein